ncbi:AAA family ATPase [Shewanella sp. KJ10-1]|uniref:AAA family ATPase n=1 Tax=Shewanella phaeophyticola TaxID=2978345 RepID=A0ABT2P2Z1_9GAMM|nr:AAA family ATPase [Shewanella sp. KJ10-1]MCT8986045.1 AAA family ATPase [Shewanella sp. KJ10-1]
MSQSTIETLLKQLASVLLGKPEQIKLAVTCILAKGHLLIEDLPGMGKTSLSQGIASSLGMSYQRIQFTSDMLPADILGVSIYSKEQQQFVFHKGQYLTKCCLQMKLTVPAQKPKARCLKLWPSNKSLLMVSPII